MSRRPANVHMRVSVTWEPHARCLAADPLRGECIWSVPSDPDALAAAKEHTAVTGHATRVVRETWTEYVRDGDADA